MTWEEKFSNWARPLSESEDERCKNAEGMIRNALNEDEELQKHDILVVAQGSYRMNTNIRQDSDVDICVLNRDYCYCDYPEGKNDDDFGIKTSEFTYTQFKNLVEIALANKFGRSTVTRGNKAIDIHANTYRIDADVVPAFEHRRYCIREDGSTYHLKGVEFRPDDGGRIINWPEQCYINSIEKNKSTGKRYKQLIRIIKNLRNEMQENRIDNTKDIASFLIESLVWNTPDPFFVSDRYIDNVRGVLAHTFNATIEYTRCKEWGEVNELKYLFGSWQPSIGQSWTMERTHNFLSAAWDYIGFK